MTESRTFAEPDMETALRWWSELPDTWTPVGWKDHPFRFNVMFNGTIAAQPHLNRGTERWSGQGVCLRFAPSAQASLPSHLARPHDNGMVIQGWDDCSAPVLWSEWAADGLLLRQQVFAHIPGGGEVQTGAEPLFAWVRLSICEICDGLPPEDRHGFAIGVNAAPTGHHSMMIRHNFERISLADAYPRGLSPESDAYDPRAGYLLLEEDGRVRLAVAPGQDCTVEFQAKETTEKDDLLYVQMETRPGAHVDLLVPMLPTEREVFDAELALGFEGALEQANRYWSQAPATAARFETPEPHVNDTIKHGLRTAEVVAETDPVTGLPCLLTGSWTYAFLWTTPFAMTCIMLLDAMGYHAAVERHLEIFRREQGAATPPGDHVPRHPGYLGTPRSLAAIDWLSDHGAVLYTICEHALLSGDQRFAEDWLPVILKACDFIRDARRVEGHGGVPGIMPPAVSNDMKLQAQAVWNDGWMFKGLATAERLLRSMGHPKAGELAAEAVDYRERFVAALRERTETMPTWTDAAGNAHRLVPTLLSGGPRSQATHPFYLDTGPLFLIFAGLMDADDPLMRSTLLWFREGPQTRMYRYDSHCSQVPSLHYEVSSCEPCYSWNVFHPHQLRDRARFLEGMYSLFAAMVSRQTFTVCESRGGVTGLSPVLLPVYLARLAVIDDQVAGDELHLLRIVPLAWLRADQESSFEDMPTEFGPVTVRAGLEGDGDGLRVAFVPEFRRRPNRVVLHVPPVPGLKRVILNDEDLGWDGEAESLLI